MAGGRTLATTGAAKRWMLAEAMSQYAAYMQQAQGGSQQQGMNSTVRWAANKRFEISNFKFKFPRA